MKSLKDFKSNINEVLKKSDDMGKWISDFLDSDAPQFKGKSKEKKMEMAKAAYYAAQKEGVMQPNGTDKVGRIKEDTVTYKHKDTGAKMSSKNLSSVGAKSLAMQLKMQQHKEVRHIETEETMNESTEALKKKAKKSGVSLSVLKKVYARGVAAWNSGHRPGTTPQQWGMARVNSYITKGKGTYHGADKDLRESKTIKVDHTAIMDSKNASYILVQDRKCVAKGSKEEMLKIHEETPNSRVWVSTANIDDLVEDKNHPYFKGLSKSTIAKRKAHWNKKDKLSDKDPNAYEPAPGDANAKTKESKHTKKYKELYGEMKEACWSTHKQEGMKKKGDKIVPNCVPKEDYEVKHLDSYKDGQQAAKDGKKYSDNPHPKNSKAHLNWSKGHNTQRANKLSEETLEERRRTSRYGSQEDTVWHHAAKEVKAIKDKMMQRQLQDLAKTLEQIGRAPNSLANLMHGNLMDKLNSQLQKLDTDVRDGVIQKFQKVGLMSEAVNPEAAAKASKKAQMTAKHADEREALAKKHSREKESMKESSAAKIVKTKLSTMANKNVRIPSPAERRAEIEKRKQMKEDTDMLSFDEYLQEDMRIAKASSMAKKYAGNMTQAVKKIDSIRKGLSNHPKVKDALKKANEELSDKQKKLDHNKNGKIDGDDLAKVRAGKTVSELDKSTLKSYASKAHQAADDHAYDADHQYNDKKEQEYSKKMAAKRAAGAAKADAKLAKEDKLDELSKKTLSSYAKQASQAANRHAYQAGKNTGNMPVVDKHIDKMAKRTAGANVAIHKLAKEEVETEETLELKSYQDFINEMDNSKRYVHKGTRYGGSAQRDTDHENDFGHDDEKEKFKRLLQKKPEKKTAPAPAVKKGRGRPAGSKSGARDYYNKK